MTIMMSALPSFQASTFQMAVLLQFNQATSFTLQQLQESTQIKMVRKYDVRVRLLLLLLFIVLI